MSKTRMVKCLICGAIFEEGPELCPVCGVPSENFVPVETEETAFSRNTQERFLVLGSGTAALSAADAIRTRNAACSITMLSCERALPYNRPMLTKNIFHGGERDAFRIHDASWYEEKNIRLITDETILSLDAEQRRVTCESGRIYEYNTCVYALGAHSFVPPIPGVDKPQVVTIRQLDDIERLARLAENAADAVVIGGGVLGLEAAWELKRRGLSVAVLENADRPLKKQLDPEASRLLFRIAAEAGVEIVTGAVTAAIEGEDRVTGVRLADGRVLPAQLVVISTGVRPNTDIFIAAGGDVGRAIRVNEYCETNLPHVYACGDCAEYQGVNFSIWPEATEQGAVAGANAAGERIAYENPRPGLSLFTMNTALYAYGDIGADPAKAYQIVRQADEARGLMETRISVSGRPVGVILIGDLTEMERLTEEIRKQA